MRLQKFLQLTSLRILPKLHFYREEISPKLQVESQKILFPNKRVALVHWMNQLFTENSPETTMIHAAYVMDFRCNERRSFRIFFSAFFFPFFFFLSRHQRWWGKIIVAYPSVFRSKWRLIRRVVALVMSSVHCDLFTL